MKVVRVYHSGVVTDWREREREMRLAGVDVTLVSARRWREAGRVVVLDRVDDFVRGATTLGSHPYRFAYAPIALLRSVRRDLDVIDLHEEPGSFAAAQVLAARWLRGATSVPLVFYSAQNIEKRYPVPFRWIETRVLRRAAAAYVCSTEAGDVLRRKGFLGEVAVVPLGIDPHLFNDSDADGAKTDGYVVGYVGRLDAHKGVDVLIRALRHVADVHVEIVGDGPEHGALEGLAAAEGVASRLRFLGPLDRAETAAFYRRIAVLAVPSRTTTAWKEQFGRVAAEAMSVGTPVVASDSGSLPEVVGPGGRIVMPDDPAALATALRELADPSVRRKVGAAARVWAEQYRWSAVAAQHVALYRRVVATR